MTDAVHVLIADDEEVFAESTADLLRCRGFRCTVASNAAEARSRLGDDVDVLVADIRMPGNADLELIRDLPTLAPGLPAILVTAFPSLESAMSSVELPVTGYLLKPLDVESLLQRLRAAVQYRRAYHALDIQRRRLAAWGAELDALQMGLKPGVGSPATADAVAALALRQVSDTLGELGLASGAEAACRLVRCPHRAQLGDALRLTVRVLEESKRSFQSRELGELRRTLVQVLAREPA